MSNVYKHYLVAADRDTGEWITEPKYSGEIDRAEWYLNKDTDDLHFDTYEAEILDESGNVIDTETRAITVAWVV